METNCDGVQNEVNSTVRQGTIDNLSVLTFCCVTVTPVNNCPAQDLVVGLPRQACARSRDVVPGPVRSLTVQPLNQRGLLILWSPPENYAIPGLEYIVSISESEGGLVGTTSVFDVSYLSVDQLEPSTLYTVTVAAKSSRDEGESKMANGSTLPPPPPPPTDLQLTAVATNSSLVIFRLSWSHPDAATYQVTGYEAMMRCNEEELDPVTSTSSSQSAMFTLHDPASNFAWCTAQVLAVNNVGRGQYSSLVSIAVPNTSPSTPRCYLYNDQGTDISISFDVTHPFSLDSLEIEYILNRLDTSEIVYESRPFNSSNVLNLPVARETRYDFQLRLCNTHGCSGYCQQLRNITTKLVS